jgi:hypothetical protein
LQENQKRLRGTLSYQHESASRYGEHQEGAEMMIVVLTAQGASFFLPALGRDSQIFEAQAATTIAAAACCSPKARGE